MKIDSQRFVAFVLLLLILAGIGMRYAVLQPYLQALAPWVIILNAVCLIGFDGSKQSLYVLFVIGVVFVGYGISFCNVAIGFPYGALQLW